MSARVALALAVLFGVGCSGRDDLAPPDPSTLQFPEVAFLVHQEVFAIRLSGTNTRSLGRVGDDKHRTGMPRWLPDGRVAVLADDTGGIYPYVGDHGGGGWTMIGTSNVTINDAICGTSVNGQPRVIYSTTPFVPTRTTLNRANPDDQTVDAVNTLRNGQLKDPAPYDDGRVLVVRSVAGVDTVEILDVSGAANQNGAREVVGLPIAMPYFAMSPARMTDGRIAFIQVDSRDIYDDPIGEIWVIGLDGNPRPTGITNVASLVATEDGRIVYELFSQMTTHTELMLTDLNGGLSANLTNTPYVDEHLGWSD